MKAFIPGQQPPPGMRALALADRVLVGLGQSGVDVDRAENLVLARHAEHLHETMRRAVGVAGIRSSPRPCLT